MLAQLIAFCFGFAATALCTTTTFWSQWAVSGPSSQTYVDPVWTWRSLWEICMQYTGEQYTCNLEVSVFETAGTSFFNLQSYLVSLRPRPLDLMEGAVDASWKRKLL